MSQQIICDECGEEIDRTQPYYTVNVQQVQVSTESAPAGAPMMALSGQPMQQRDFHEDHLPEGLAVE